MGKEPKHIYPAQHYNLDAPREIVPFLIEKFQPGSVIDVGCGTGTFLKIFNENGIHDILGIDGNWVERTELLISEHFFIEKDLEKDFHIGRKFDMVLCLEVAEHLEENSADKFIDNLIRLGNIIIYSAAIVHQGGQNHLNEQPFEYWIKKFEKRGFIFYDIFRESFWKNPKINWWYKQNMFLVMHKSMDVSKFGINRNEQILEYVHPGLFAMRVNELNKYKEKISWIKNGNAPLKFYLELLRNKIAKKFTSSKRRQK